LKIDSLSWLQTSYLKPGCDQYNPGLAADIWGLRVSFNEFLSYATYPGDFWAGAAGEVLEILELPKGATE